MNKRIVFTAVFIVILSGCLFVSNKSASAMEDMVIDGMIFHSNMPLFTAKDRAIGQDIASLDKMMKEGRFSEAKPLLNRLMTKIKSESPTTSNPSGEKYSTYTYQSLKYWKKKLPKAYR